MKAMWEQFVLEMKTVVGQYTTVAGVLVLVGIVVGIAFMATT
jgi:hypothetical protein